MLTVGSAVKSLKSSKRSAPKKTSAKAEKQPKVKVAVLAVKAGNKSKRITAKDNKLAFLKRTLLYEHNLLDRGRLLSVKDGVAKISGLIGVRAGEMVTLGLDKLPGMILSLEHNSVNAVIFGNDRSLTQGD
jgi:hypothetical protein